MYHKLKTEEMKQFNPLTPDTTLESVFSLRKAEEQIHNIRKMAEESFIYEQIREIIETDYDIGNIEEIYEIFGGYVNKSYGIYVNKDGERHTWFFRKYMRNKDLNELMMEHTLLIYAKAQGFEKGATPIPAKSGITYATREERNPDGTMETWYFAVYEYIPGNATYDWINNDLPPVSYNSCAEVLAEFHNAARDFAPKTYSRAEHNINLLMTEFPEDFKGYIKSYKENGYTNCFCEYFEESQDYIDKMCRKAIIPEEDFAKLPVVPNQSDLHPANFKYNEDGTVSGFFDFDWAKMDIRLFELGFGCSYFFSSWDSDRDGDILVEKVIDFINTYNNHLRKLNGLMPMTELEKKYFFEAMVMGTEYLVRWASEACFKDNTLNPYEYLYYMQHEVRVLQWLENHEEEVRTFSSKF